MGSRLKTLKENLRYPFIRISYKSSKLTRLSSKYYYKWYGRFCHWLNEKISTYIWYPYRNTIAGFLAWHDLLLEMCEEIKKVPHKGLRIYYVKEKYGLLSIFSYNTSDEVYNIIRKYENKSRDICIYCGNETKYATIGWIEYFCSECAKKSGKYYVLKDKVNDFYDEYDAFLDEHNNKHDKESAIKEGFNKILEKYV